MQAMRESKNFHPEVFPILATHHPPLLAGGGSNFLRLAPNASLLPLLSGYFSSPLTFLSISEYLCISFLLSWSFFYFSIMSFLF